MQYGRKLGDYPTHQRIHATYFDEVLRAQIQEDMGTLTPHIDTRVVNLKQIPGMDYYTVTLIIETTKPICPGEVVNRISGRPRIMVLPPNIRSTFEIDHFMREPYISMRYDIPPITVFTHNLGRTDKETSFLCLEIGIYSRMIAVLPNLDAIQIFGKKMRALAAMSRTDSILGFPQ